jgi:ABC-type transport system substrate-binding protein
MEERKKYYYRAQELVMSDVPAIFTHNDLDVMAIRKHVEGYKHSAIQLNNLFDKVWLKQ